MTPIQTLVCVHSFLEPFQYVSWELSALDQDEEAEDIEALAELEKAAEGSSDSYGAEEEEDEVSILISVFTLKWCNEAFQNVKDHW